jgi:hypothetical protein
MWYMFHKYSSVFSQVRITATPDVNETLVSNKNFEDCALLKAHKNFDLTFNPMYDFHKYKSSVSYA